MAVQKAARRWRIVAGQRRSRARERAVEETRRVTGEDMKEAEKTLVKAIQGVSFGQEIEEMERKGIRSPNQREEVRRKDSKIMAHNPFMDTEGIVRVGSRLANATIPEEAKFPAILPKEGEEVRALIRKCHREERHAGAKHTLCQLRQKYWIVQGLQAVKKEVKRCVTCQKAYKEPESQKMAPLPLERVAQNAPFFSTGVDMMGPFRAKMNGQAIH